MNAQTDLNVPIRIIDDDIDEANEQFFIVQIIVANAMTEGSLIIITRNISNCSIVDNDRE